MVSFPETIETVRFLLPHRVFYNAFKIERKGFVTQRLYDITDRGHGITLQGVLTQISYEDDVHGLIYLSEFMADIHSVAVRHLYVHEHDIVNGR